MGGIIVEFRYPDKNHLDNSGDPGGKSITALVPIYLSEKLLSEIWKFLYGNVRGFSNISIIADWAAFSNYSKELQLRGKKNGPIM